MPSPASIPRPSSAETYSAHSTAKSYFNSNILVPFENDSILSFEFYIFNSLLYNALFIDNGNIKWKAPTIDERKDIINRFIQQKMAYIEGLGLGFEDLIDHSIDPNINQETDITVKLNYHAPEEKIDLIRVLLKMQGYPVNAVITDTSDMFKNCASLTSIDLSALTSIPKSKLKF